MPEFQHAVTIRCGGPYCRSRDGRCFFLDGGYREYLCRLFELPGDRLPKLEYEPGDREGMMPLRCQACLDAEKAAKASNPSSGIAADTVTDTPAVFDLIEPEKAAKDAPAAQFLKPTDDAMYEMAYRVLDSKKNLSEQGIDRSLFRKVYTVGDCYEIISADTSKDINPGIPHECRENDGHAEGQISDGLPQGHGPTLGADQCRIMGMASTTRTKWQEAYAAKRSASQLFGPTPLALEAHRKENVAWEEYLAMLPSEWRRMEPFICDLIQRYGK